MTSKKDVLSETFIWEGKEENEEPENRESIEIILARGVMNTRAMMKEGDEDSALRKIYQKHRRTRD